MKIFKKIAVSVLIIVCTTNTLSVSAEENYQTYPWDDNLSVNVESWPEAPATESESAILMDVSTGAILYEKEIYSQHYPASITKVLTTLVALEHMGALDETVTFSHDSVFSIERGSTHIGMKEDEEITLDQCLHAVMMASANECSYALAEHISNNDYAAFIQMMNATAAASGARNSNFKNAHGLPDEEHYTTAYDMARISIAAFQYEKFQELISTYRYEIPATNLSEESRPFTNHHQMLPQRKYPYEGCLGGKTGYTQAAGNTLVTFAERDGLTLVCVTLKGAGKAAYNDTAALLDYGFNNFESINIKEAYCSSAHDYSDIIDPADYHGNKDKTCLTMSDTGTAVVPKGVTFSDLEPSVSTDTISNSSLGTLLYTYNDRYVGYTDLTGASNVPENEILATIYTAPAEENKEPAAKEPTEKAEKSSVSPVKIIVTLLILIVLVAAVFFISTKSTQNRKRHRRK